MDVCTYNMSETVEDETAFRNGAVIAKAGEDFFDFDANFDGDTDLKSVSFDAIVTVAVAKMASYDLQLDNNNSH